MIFSVFSTSLAVNMTNFVILIWGWIDWNRLRFWRSRMNRLLVEIIEKIMNSFRIFWAWINNKNKIVIILIIISNNSSKSLSSWTRLKNLTKGFRWTNTRISTIILISSFLDRKGLLRLNRKKMWIWWQGSNYRSLMNFIRI